MIRITLFFAFCCVFTLTYAQTKPTPEHLQEKKIKQELANFINERITSYKLPSDLLEEVRQNYDGSNLEEFIKSYTKKLKENKLREEFFSKHPSYSQRVQNQQLNNSYYCYMSGFDRSATFFHNVYNTTSFSSCNMTPVTQTLYATNDNIAMVSIVDPGSDPQLSNLGINLPRTLGSNSFSLRLNDIHDTNNIVGGFDVTRARLPIWDDTSNGVTVNFSAILQNPGHNENDQPYVQFQLFDTNGELLDERCIVSDPNDCNFNQAGNSNYLYTDWTCITLSTEELTTNNCILEVTVGDCGLGGHQGYAYIDLCEQECQNPVFGSIDLAPIEGTCPEFPLEICGTYLQPANNQSLPQMTLSLIPEDSQNPTIVNATPTFLDADSFCFTLNENDFPATITGQYEAFVEASFTLDCNQFTHVITDNSTNPGPDIDFNGCGNTTGGTPLWPRTYGNGGRNRQVCNIEVDENNNVYTLAVVYGGDYSYEDSNFTANDKSVILTKHNADGAQIWTKYLTTDIDFANNRYSLSYFSNKLYLLTKDLTLYCYSSNGDLIYSYSIGNNTSSFLEKNYIDVDKTTGNIYLAVAFDQNANTGDYNINASSNDQKLGILKFNNNGTYNSSYITNLSITDEISGFDFVEEQNALFVSINNYANNSTGYRFNTNSTISLTDSYNYPFKINNLTYNANYNRLYFEREYYSDTNSSANYKIYRFGSSYGFTSTPYLVYDGYDGYLTDLYYSETDQAIYATAVSDFNFYAKIIKIKNNTLEWEMNTNNNIEPITIAKGYGENIYIGGHYYNNDNSLGTQPIYTYPNGVKNLFIARIKDEGNSGVFGRPASEEKVEITPENVFTIYPVPTSDVLTIEQKIPKQEKFTLSIRDLSGMEVLKSKHSFINTSTKLDISRLKFGLYVLEIKSEKGTVEYHRIVKE